MLSFREAFRVATVRVPSTSPPSDSARLAQVLLAIELHTGKTREELAAAGVQLPTQVTGIAKEFAREWFRKTGLYRPTAPKTFNAKTGLVNR